MVRRTNLDWWLEGVSLAVLAAMFAYLSAHWADLPDRVPTHYGALGEPNAWGGKASLWLQPAVAAGTFLLLTLASFDPRWIHLPVRVDRKRPEVRSLLLTLSICLKAVLTLLFAYITWAGINTALGRLRGLGSMFLPVFLIATFAPLFYFFQKLRRYRLTK